MSVAQAQREIDAREFATWMAYARVEPFGEERADLRAGIVAATIANANRGKGIKAFEPADFMPTFESKRKQTADEMQSRMFQFAELHNRAIGAAPRK